MAFLLGAPAALTFLTGMGASLLGIRQIENLLEEGADDGEGATTVGEAKAKKASQPASDEAASLRALEQAAIAASKGTYGIGAVLLDASGEVVCEGHNEVLVGGRFRSDLHAEMVVLNKWEDAHPTEGGLSEYTLVSTLEPCPMCLTRLIMAGVGTIVYVCPDDIGGMVQRIEAMPPVFRGISERQGQRMRAAKCSEAVRQRAFTLWNSSQEKIDAMGIERAKKPANRLTD